MSKPPMACPKCARTNFAVEAVQHVVAYIEVNDTEIEQVDSHSDHTEWNEDSNCRCRHCQFEGKAGEFLSNEHTSEAA